MASLGKVLVVDDEISLVQLCELVLQSAGFSVCGALSGRQALRLIDEQDPDLVLLDVIMPGDLHALTTHYEQTEIIEQSVWNVIIDWLSVGVNPGACKIFIQSKVPEHCELFTLLSMITPLSWLERVPTYKDQQEKLKVLDLATYGFLGYPLLQSADILAYKAGLVPVGEDQLSHLELTREVARRFNFLYGKDKGFQEKVNEAIEKMGKKNAKMYFAVLKAISRNWRRVGIRNGSSFSVSPSQFVFRG